MLGREQVPPVGTYFWVCSLPVTKVLRIQEHLQPEDSEHLEILLFLASSAPPLLPALRKKKKKKKENGFQVF